MNECILKSQWERFRQPVALDKAQASRLIEPYCSASIKSFHLLSNGCANTNYKVLFEKENLPPLVLRIYTRESASLQREIDLQKFVANQIPVPIYLYSDSSLTLCSHPYALIEWIDGILMRDVVLANDAKAIAQCSFEAGKYLAMARNIHFESGGFFEDGLRVRPFSPDEEYIPFASKMLEDKIVKESLGPTLHQATCLLLENNIPLMPPSNEPANLTHADFDPANIIVKQEESGKWRIGAILDWEFAFAGTYLLDMGMMLRYSHRLPATYEQKFVAGIEQHHTLPKYWKKQAKLMDLLCLLQLTHYNPVTERPIMNRDVVSLIQHSIENWSSF